ncbi:MAG: putative MPP superfamily phosphohydrolase [Halioglobus sp.]|jgi:predicted MPP superfamily phosphohydrolase
MTSHQSRRRSGRVNFLIVVLLLHIPLFAYPILRICGWLGLGATVTTLIFLPLFFSQIVARVVLKDPANPWTKGLRWSADIWLGISPVVLVLVLLAEIPIAFSSVAPEVAAFSILVLSVFLAAYGVYSAHSPTTVIVQLTSEKLHSSRRFVQISDVHVGSRSKRFLEHVIDRVNALEPDFLCITGDFIDATGISEEHLGALSRVQGPVYFSIGNHEKYEDLEAIVQRLRNLGVNVLRNQTLHEEHLQVIGIDDMEDHGQVERELAKIEIHDHKYIVLLYHRPRGHEAAAAAGVDLMLSGHTHNGQIVPFNLVVNRVFEKAKGLFLEGRTHLYVSSGTGTWGPSMRLGTRGEITLFEVSATRKS